ncbi:MAG TPA: 16S rRNA (cytosine(967)-C(5))-methyltransferase RsmB [Chthoniobacterales bacterium]|nr:16S rRNA (cytosine(967)-C(5))-methyltransferase RsmB [Chthoniobacterales bacterium]
MAQLSARRVALAALKIWRTRRYFADRVISRLLDDALLKSTDRAFAVELFYGVLRNLTLLDFWIASLRPRRIDVDVRDVLRLGLYQLFIAKTSEHAAVYETVHLVTKRQRPIINGILRSAIRKETDLRQELRSQPQDIRFSHPKFLIERWGKEFGDEATTALCEWNNRPPPIYARINRLKTDLPNFLERYRDARSIPNIANFVELSSPNKALSQGDCYIQDPSTAIACELLEPKPGEKILDACAAPGGKTAYLAELMQNDGLILACDREADRLSLVQENVDRLGARIAEIFRHDWTKTETPEAIHSLAPFDRILIDAPCSNTGVMRRRVDVRWRLKPTEFGRMRDRQLEIAHAVSALLKPAGILVYSTCSLEREENEEVTRALIRDMPSFKLEEQRKCLPFTNHFDGAFAARFRRTN